ncbi:MAG: thiamine phosphate synthase [Reyranellaceae bacterium]
MSDCQLYLITPPAFDPAAFAPLLARALAGGPVAALQIRLKDAADETVGAAVRALTPLCHDKGVAVILNDRPDLAAELGCDGVHVGQDDTPYREARRLMGPDRTVGVTCHDSRHLAMEAAEAGADYVAFGAFFPTATKEPRTRADPDLLRWWSELMTVPCVAIGGITTENCPVLIQAGADFLAVSAGVWNHEGGPDVAVGRFAELMKLG